MMIPKEKRSLPLKILIRSLIPFTTFVLVLYVFGFAAGQEKGGGWNSHQSEEIYGLPIELACRFASDYWLWWVNIVFVLWVVGATTTIAYTYTKHSEDMKAAEKTKGMFFLMVCSPMHARIHTRIAGAHLLLVHGLFIYLCPDSDCFCSRPHHQFRVLCLARLRHLGQPPHTQLGVPCRFSSRSRHVSKEP